MRREYLKRIEFGILGAILRMPDTRTAGRFIFLLPTIGLGCRFSPTKKIHADGWIANFSQTGNRLYVNRGIGFSTFPVRINCRPELTMFTMRRGNH